MKEARERASGVLGESEKRGAQIVEEAKAAAEGRGRPHHRRRARADRLRSRQGEDGAARAGCRTSRSPGAEKILQREVDAKAHADMLGKLKAEL